jgi:hypothetical protein
MSAEELLASIGETQHDGYRQANYRAGVITRDDDAVEAVRFYKTEGAGFTGWIVRSTTDPCDYSDPIPTKGEAIAMLLRWGR